MLSIGIPRLEGRLDERFATIISRMERYLPDLDRSTLERAYQFASEIHASQTRRSGEPYIIHPLEVAHILADLEVDAATVTAALLHDTIEDGMLAREDGEVTQVTVDDLTERFGETVASLVNGVTKLGSLHFHSHEARQAENLRKMLLATAKDVRVVLIKLADRFHNMRTLKFMNEVDQKRIADETLHIYAPIAHRLGVWKLKWELEDLAFRTLEPQKYREIQTRVNRTRGERENVINNAIRQLQENLQQLEIDATVAGRPKHFYSIYNKMKEQSISFDEVLDLEAIRVIVNTEKECYEVLGLVHRLWMPINMFTDYIGKPKMNNYQSLHTKVIETSGQLLEVQIRTKEMHRVAEVGVAAHWNYKEGGSSDAKTDQKMAWIRGLLELQAESKTDADWLESIKLDLFKDQVFVFTPQGDIIDLPAGATPIDFAFRIHTDLGLKCGHAKVNGVLVPLSYKFVNSDVVEIFVNPRQHPSLDWLKLVASNSARSKIKAYFRKLGRDNNIRVGREALEEECKREGLSFTEVQKSEKFLALIAKHNLTALDDLFAMIGFGDLSVEGVIHRIRDDIPHRTALDLQQAISQNSPVQPSLPTLINPDGVDNISYNIAKCCHPIPGDHIIGYVTRGKGVAIHRLDCPNLRNMQRTPEEKERLMALDWKDDGNGTHLAEIEITAADRIGLFADISAIFTDMKTNIRSAKLDTDAKKHTSTMIVQIDTTGVDKLQEIIARIMRESDVLSVHRRNSKKRRSR